MRGEIRRILSTESKFSPAPAAEADHVQRSQWHSPLPYFFGGLAAILGLIAFALLMLACSYFRNSGDDSDRDVEAAAAGEKTEDADKTSYPVFEEKILVILAGNLNPTCLATPMSCRRSSLDGDSQGNRFEGDQKQEFEAGEKRKEDDDAMDDHIQRVLSENPNRS